MMTENPSPSKQRPPLTDESFEALLKDPKRVSDLWELVKEKYLSALDGGQKEKALRERAEVLGLPNPVYLLDALDKSDPKEALFLLHYQSPQLDLANPREESDQKVAFAVLGALNYLHA